MEAFGPDDDYLDKLKYKKDHGVPNPEVAASKARTAAAKAKQKEIDKKYLDILKSNPEADSLFDAIQDYGYNNDYDLSGAEDMLQQFLDLFPDGPVRRSAKRSVTNFH
jgi:TolA-binding protein